MPDPDFVYDPDNWEETFNWGDHHQLEDNVERGQIQSFSTLIRGPDKFCAMVPIEGEDPENGDCEHQWFDSVEEAKAAMQGKGPW